MFARHKLGKVDGCRFKVMTDQPVTATVFVEADQSKESLLYVPQVPP